MSKKMGIMNPKEKLFHLQEVIHSCELSTNEIAVYTTLVIFVNSKTGKCFPSRKVIAERVNLSVRSVARVISQLKDKGLIDVKSGTNGKSNEYLFLHYSEIATMLCNDDMDDTGDESLGGHELHTKEDKMNVSGGHELHTIIYKDNYKDLDKDKIQIEFVDDSMQDYYDSVFGNIIN